jgi:hypothetical protein
MISHSRDAVDARRVDAHPACFAGVARGLRGARAYGARPDVHVDRLVREDGVVLTWFVSYADEAIEVRPELADGCVRRDPHTRLA